MNSKPLRARIGGAFLAARTDQHVSLRDLAARCAVSKSHIADVEAGRYAGTPEVLDRIADGLDAEIIFGLRRSISIGAAPGPRRGGDPAHARCLGSTQRIFERRGFECASEVRVDDGRAHGWIDLLAFDRTTRRLVVVEFKTELRDFGGLERQVDVYARGCLTAARSLGWDPVEVLIVVVVLATVENDAAIAANRTMLARAFPVRGRAAAAAMLNRAPLTGRGLVMIDPHRAGRLALTSCRSDGRRSDAPYADYADFMHVTRALDVERSIRRGSRGAAASALPSGDAGQNHEIQRGESRRSASGRMRRA